MARFSTSRFPSGWTVGVSVAFALGGAYAGADGVVGPAVPRSGSVAYPVSAPTTAPATPPVYRTWTTPQTGGYSGWTTPRPSGYGSWTTPGAGSYGTWGTSPGTSAVYGVPAMPAIPATAAVVAPCAPVSDPVCAPPCDRSTLSVGTMVRYWRPSIRGDVVITNGGVPGSATSVDVRDDLGLFRANAFEVGLSASFDRHRAFLAYERDKFSATSRLGRTIVYHGASFPAGGLVASDLALTFWKLGYDYAFVGDPLSSSGVLVRGGVAAWLWKYDGRLRSLTTNADTSRKFSHVMPVATFSAEGTFDWFRAGARASGGLLGENRYVIDLEASVGVKFWRVVALDVGYRWMNLSFVESTNLGDLTLTGPFAELSVLF